MGRNYILVNYSRWMLEILTNFAKEETMYTVYAVQPRFSRRTADVQWRQYFWFGMC